MIGGLEILVIFFIALLLFGPKKIPEIARTLGEAVREFRKASNPLLIEKPKVPQRDDELLLKVAKELGINIEGKNREEIVKEIVEKARGQK